MHDTSQANQVSRANSLNKVLITATTNTQIENDISKQNANLFVGYVEQQIFEQYTGPIPDFFGRYIDDCLGTASCTRADLEGFINYVTINIIASCSQIHMGN